MLHLCDALLFGEAHVPEVEDGRHDVQDLVLLLFGELHRRHGRHHRAEVGPVPAQLLPGLTNATRLSMGTPLFLNDIHSSPLVF